MLVASSHLLSCLFELYAGVKNGLCIGLIANGGEGT